MLQQPLSWEKVKHSERQTTKHKRRQEKRKDSITNTDEARAKGRIPNTFILLILKSASSANVIHGRSSLKKSARSSPSNPCLEHIGGLGLGGDFAENFLLNKRSCAAFIGRISNVKMSVSTRHPILQKSTVERKKSPIPS